MPIIMTPDGPAIWTDAGPLKLVRTAHGTAVQTPAGLVLISSALKAAFVVDEMVQTGDVEAAEGEPCRFTFKCSPAAFDILGSWGAEAEDEEDDGSEEPDNRDLPRSLSSCEAAPAVAA
ncbi:hypothetical protein [Methylobacterium nodulans]|uniref:Uncharacterized protein n=1 Tax=Methylobacterium nodulans (strain LMG 21967 / CNCM I-2342 / ORS 2060) TaxID=460265 RepID=B8IY44_METNO|nr:hypothetical protein [Methylobacterium nodulans]ACL63334.1 hypothetical protein Mnod_7741 [Methylobacterium nodulans ORS 2060]